MVSTTQKKVIGLSFALALTALTIGGIIMGMSPVFVRIAEVSSFVSAFWRVLFALPFLALWAYYEARKADRPFRVNFTLPAVLAGIFFAGDLTFWHLAILNTTLANSTFTLCLAPVWVVLLSRVTINEQIPIRAIIGLALCLFGVALLINATLQFNPDQLIGDIYGLITSIFLGLYFLAIRAGRRNTGSGSLFFASSIVTGLVLFLVALASGDPMLPKTSTGWAALFSLGAFTHAGGQGLITIAMGSLSAMFSSLSIFIEAVAAAFSGWLFFDETLGPSEMLGGLLTLIGVWYARPKSGVKK